MSWSSRRNAAKKAKIYCGECGAEMEYSAVAHREVCSPDCGPGCDQYAACGHCGACTEHCERLILGMGRRAAAGVHR
jgi:hypothetical protein